MKVYKQKKANRKRKFNKNYLILIFNNAFLLWLNFILVPSSYLCADYTILRFSQAESRICAILPLRGSEGKNGILGVWKGNLPPIKRIEFIIKCNKSLKPKMEGQQIPKATMNNFIKSKLKLGFSADFANRFLVLAKDYINRLTEQANDICTKNDKKTINAEHIESALLNFGLENQLKELKEMSSQIKEQNQIKQQFRQRIQQNIEKNLQEIEGEDEGPRVVSIKQNIQMIEIDNSENSEDIDYEAEMNEEGSEDGRKKESSKQMESEEGERRK